MLEFLKCILFGIIEGITEWIPVSSTAHMMLLDEFLHLDGTEDFVRLFEVVIQVGAILAVILLYFRKLWPFYYRSKTVEERKDSWILIAKICVAVLPSAVIGFLIDDAVDAALMAPNVGFITVASTLVLYGIAFVLSPKWLAGRKERVTSSAQITFRDALFVGLFQCLALIPGTSRSGTTILGAMLLGFSCAAAIEFSFLMAIPTVLGAAGLKIVKSLIGGMELGAAEWGMIAVGLAVSFAVSFFCIKKLIDFVGKHGVSAFGWYRIALGLTIFGYFAVKLWLLN